MGQRCPSDSDGHKTSGNDISHLPMWNSSIHVYVGVLFHFLQEWNKLERPRGAPWPVERSGHAACCLNYGEEHPQLLVTGGVDLNDNTLQDAWILDVKSGRWKEVSGDMHMNVDWFN